MKKEELIDEIKSISKKLDEKSLDKVLKNEAKIEKKRKALDPQKFFRLFKQVKLSLEMLKDYKKGVYRNIPWKAIAIIVTAVIYFLNPIDLIPDFMGILGFTDDAIVLGVVFTSLKQEMKRYCEWKGYNWEDYI